jgi:carbamate kinase
VEMHTIANAISHGHIVIAGVGGGIPVTKIKGRLKGIEAVIDKDLTAGLLASDLHADKFVILTNVPHVSTGFATSRQRPILSLDEKTARRLLDSGEFPPGSIRPKVEAALHHAMATGCKALITDLEHLDEALAGREGTWIGD